MSDMLLEDAVRNDIFRMRNIAYEARVSTLKLVADSITSGLMGHVIKRAHEAFEAGIDDAELENMMRHVFEARLALLEGVPAAAAAGEDVTALVDLIAYADDEVHAVHKSAVLFIGQDGYDNAVDGYRALLSGLGWRGGSALGLRTGANRAPYLPDVAWWCTREYLDHVVPDGVVEQALFALADKPD